MLNAASRESRESDEVVEVFSGSTLEEAMAYAVAGLGPDLTVRRARKVRKGLQGLAGKDRYEVVAIPAPRQSSDVVGNAFESLLARAELQEGGAAPQAGPQAAPGPRAVPDLHHEPAPEPVRRLTRAATPSLPPAVLEAVPDTPLLRPAPDLEPEPVAVRRPVPKAPTPRRTAPRRPAGERRSRQSDAVVPQPVAGVVWSRAALRAAGLPKAVLSALPEKDPRDDAGWIRALSTALATVLAPPAVLDDAHPLIVHVQGLAGVVALLDGSARGLRPGTVTYGGRTAPATATELALAVRAELSP